MEDSTDQQFEKVLARCRSLFERKLKDYGPAWLIFRPASITDQILIKALRIRSLEQKEDRALIPETRDVEYVGIINYSIIGLMIMWFDERLPSAATIFQPEQVRRFSDDSILACYDAVTAKAGDLMRRKNHDYDEAWRAMRLSSITDQMLVKLARLRQIESNAGELIASEGTDSQYCDILNYAVFGLLLMPATAA
ncbi:MAG: hypothetical protein JWL59_4300 [Chthoniobacteraceae bacterium]|nr:hypothetical protein [Chthoniobacteraceae bacterium]